MTALLSAVAFAFAAGYVLGIPLGFGVGVGCSSGCSSGAVDSSSVGEGVVHGQLLLQISDLLLVPFDLQCWVHHDIDCSLVGDFHHARGKLQRRIRLLNMPCLGPDIGHHDCLTIATKGVSEEVRKLCLSVGDMVTLGRAESQDHLLEER